MGHSESILDPRAGVRARRWKQNCNHLIWAVTFDSKVCIRVSPHELERKIAFSAIDLLDFDQTCWGSSSLSHKCVCLSVLKNFALYSSYRYSLKIAAFRRDRTFAVSHKQIELRMRTRDSFKNRSAENRIIFKKINVFPNFSIFISYLK